jgi:ABC-type multidrug transport system fused ATPase/permease subunit
VLKTVRKALNFMTPKERAKYNTFLGLRAFVAVFDLIGILAIGFLATSIALFISLGSDSNRLIEFAGVTLPAVTAQTLPVVAILILFLFVGKAMVAIGLTRQLAYFLAKIEARAAKAVAQNAFGSGLAEARKHSREEIYFAVQAGSPAAFNSLLNSVGTIVAEGLLFALVIGSFFLVDPASALGAMLYFGLIALVIQFFIGNLLQKASLKTTIGVVEANSAIGDLSEVLREASILNNKAFFFSKIHDARIRAASSNASQLVLSGMPRYIVETSLIIAVALFVLLQSASGDLVSAAGTVGVFLSGGLRLTASLLPMQSALLSIKQSIPPAESALALLGNPKEVSSELSELQAGEVVGGTPIGIELNEISFSYPDSGKVTLDRISLDIAAGQQAALIGHSGSGKSTIAELILGLLEPSSGSVELGGKNPSHIIRRFPGALSYVPQKPGMVSGSIVDNIALGVGKEAVDLVRLQKAIKDAHLSEIIDSLPEGIDTDLGKRGDELSGGQLQRIGLARALYTQPSLLVMDEATSALDADSENEINKALDEMRGKVTVILIAHRLNTVQRSDVVFLVEEGRITASGTFNELLRTNKTVQNLANLMSIQSRD